MKTNRFILSFLTLLFIVQSAHPFDLATIAQSAFSYSKEKGHLPAFFAGTAIVGGIFYAHKRYNAHKTRTYLKSQRELLEKNELLLESNLETVQKNSAEFYALENLYGQLELENPRNYLNQLEPIEYVAPKMKSVKIPVAQHEEFALEISRLNARIADFKKVYKANIQSIKTYAILADLHNLFVKIYNKHAHSIALCASNCAYERTIAELISEYCPNENLLIFQTADLLDKDICLLESELNKAEAYTEARIQNGTIYAKINDALLILKKMSFMIKQTDQYARELAIHEQIESLKAQIHSLKRELEQAHSENRSNRSEIASLSSQIFMLQLQKSSIKRNCCCA